MMKSSLLPRLAGLATFVALAGMAHATLPITPGNLVVVHVGDGTAALSGASTAVFLEEFTTAGVPVNTVTMPTAAAGLHFPCTVSGSATSESWLTVSGSGSSSKLVMAGYGIAPGNTVVTVAATVVPRVIATVDLNGVIDTTTALADAYSNGNIRSACSDNGLQFWTSGTTTFVGQGGVRYATIGATTSVQVNQGLSNVRFTDIAAGNIYCSSASSTWHGVSAVGSGLPTAAGVAATTILNGFSTTSGPSAYDFYFADATTLYVADDRTSGLGGIQKWTFNGTVWALQYTLAPALNIGCRGVTGNNVGGTVTLYATTTQTNANSIVSVVDTGVSSVFTTLATAAALTKFQGIRYVPSFISPPTTTFCAGDAPGTCTACVPNNNGVLGHGCANSVYASGALLQAGGVPSTTADTLTLICTKMPGPGLFFQANGLISPSPFGDGQLCAAIGIIRMGVVFPTADTGTYPGGTTPAPISLAGAPVNPGDVKHYQCWYRDNPVFCSTDTFNTSNGLTLTWQ